MPSKLLSIARMGSRPFLDATAYMHNGHDHAWLMEQIKRLDAGETTKREICEAMNVTAPTLTKYIFVINFEKVQHGGGRV